MGIARAFTFIFALTVLVSGCTSGIPMLVPNEEKIPLPTMNEEQWIQGIEVKVLDIE